jgi:hypothetical protein
MNNFSGGLENIDFLGTDVEDLEELLQGLAASNIFSKPNGAYVFPDFLLNQLKAIPSMGSYFLDPTPYLVEYDNDATDLYTIVTQDFYQISNQVSTRMNWYGVKTLIVDAQSVPILDTNGDLQYEYIGGEIENIVDFIDELQSISIGNFTSGTGIDGTMVRRVMLSLNEATSLRVLIYNMFESIFSEGNIDFGTVSFSNTNTLVFLEVDKAERANQIEDIADLIDTIASMGLNGGGLFDLFDETTTTSPYELVDDLLNILNNSLLFNPLESNENDMTVFEDSYQFLLTNALDTFTDDCSTCAAPEQALYDELLELNETFNDSGTTNIVNLVNVLNLIAELNE